MRDPHASNSGTWRLGDRTVNRIGYGTKRLPRDRDAAVTVLGSPEHLTENLAAGALRLSPDDLDALTVSTP